jgi:ribulose 1,5-bisphosphate carboxylase large subunit-like protein
MSNEIISVDYRFPPEIDAEKQAKIIAIGQTAGTWTIVSLTEKRNCANTWQKLQK